jgi:signal transduction histidine kinase
VPSARAFWWFVAAEALYLPVAVLAQFHALYKLPWAEPVARFVYFVGVLATLRAAVHFREDPVAKVPDRVSPAWLLGLNPLTFLMPAALGTALVLALWRGPEDKVVPLGLSLLTVTLLLVLRLVVTAYQNARLQEEERAAHERLLQVRQEERVRLLADMHDGFGSQLVSARIRVSRAELGRAQLEGVLAECLADLALVTDSIRAPDDSLETAISDWRARLDERLAGHGCRLHWKLELVPAPQLPSGHILQVLRVLQEAVGNALRHAHAQNIWIDVRSSRGAPLSLCVSDDGVGLPAAAVGGRGMEFMRKRAGNVGGLLTLGPREGGPGTSVRLDVPVAQSRSPAAETPR